MNRATERTEIADGVFFTAITDKRFKLNRVSVTFLTQLDEKTNAANALFPTIISKSNSRYNNYTKLNNKLSALYAASISDSNDSFGDTLLTGVTAFGIDDAFALDGEKITDEITDILIDCLFSPVLENGFFPASTVELEKQTAIDAIEAELNDKIAYARNKAIEAIFAGEPAALRPFGTVDEVRAITAESVYKAYKNALEKYRVEIVCVGSNDFVSVKDKLAAAFAGVKRSCSEKCSSEYSALKTEPTVVTEKLAVSQSKLVLGFKSDCHDKNVMAIMAMIYGGTPSSKLFTNVREKMSLCYYCSSRYNHLKGMMLVNSGVENANIDRAKTEILRQLDDIKNGDFTDEEIEYAKVAWENGLKAINDGLSSIHSWEMSNIYEGTDISPSEKIAQMRTITREQIIDAAKSVSLDTVYILTSNGEESGEDE